MDSFASCPAHAMLAARIRSRCATMGLIHSPKRALGAPICHGGAATTHPASACGPGPLHSSRLLPLKTPAGSPSPSPRHSAPVPPQSARWHDRPSVGCSSSPSPPPEGTGAEDPEGVRNEVGGGRSAEWMGDDAQKEIASRLIARWKKEGAAQSQGRGGLQGSVPFPPPAPPQDMLLQAVSDLSRKEGRSAKTTNVVMGGTAATAYGDDWLELDKKVNTYPSWRGFTAIGTGGDDFVESMVGAVESVIEVPIPKWQVSARESAKGRYVSVKIGPVRMESSDQVRAVYQAMKKDERMRYFL